jgi:hypothetical protein
LRHYRQTKEMAVNVSNAAIAYTVARCHHSRVVYRYRATSHSVDHGPYVIHSLCGVDGDALPQRGSYHTSRALQSSFLWFIHFPIQTLTSRYFFLKKEDLHHRKFVFPTEVPSATVTGDGYTIAPDIRFRRRPRMSRVRLLLLILFLLLLVLFFVFSLVALYLALPPPAVRRDLKNFRRNISNLLVFIANEILQKDIVKNSQVLEKFNIQGAARPGMIYTDDMFVRVMYHQDNSAHVIVPLWCTRLLPARPEPKPAPSPRSSPYPRDWNPPRFPAPNEVDPPIFTHERETPMPPHATLTVECRPIDERYWRPELAVISFPDNSRIEIPLQGIYDLRQYVQKNNKILATLEEELRAQEKYLMVLHFLFDESDYFGDRFFCSEGLLPEMVEDPLKYLNQIRAQYLEEAQMDSLSPLDNLRAEAQRREITKLRALGAFEEESAPETETETETETELELEPEPETETETETELELEPEFKPESELEEREIHEDLLFPELNLLDEDDTEDIEEEINDRIWDMVDEFVLELETEEAFDHDAKDWERIKNRIKSVRDAIRRMKAAAQSNRIIAEKNEDEDKDENENENEPTL